MEELPTQEPKLNAAEERERTLIGQFSNLTERQWVRAAVTILLAVSSTWFLLHALSDFEVLPGQFVLFDGMPELMARIVLGMAGVIATGFQAYYWSKSLSQKKNVKLAINHYVRNRMQFLLLAMELFNADPSPENMRMLKQARVECELLIREVDLIVEEKLKVPSSAIPKTRS